MSATSRISAGTSANRLGERQAAAFERQGRNEYLSALEEEQRFRANSERFQGDQRLQFLKSGVDIGSGSAAEVLAEDARRMELDALTIRYGGQKRAEALRDEASFAREEGQAKRSAGFISAGAEALSVGPDVWDAFKRVK